MPVCLIEAPAGIRSDDKKRLILILHNEYPLENAGWAGRLQSDNPEIVEAMKELNGDPV